MTNLKQLGLGLAMYSQDYREAFPFYNSGNNNTNASFGLALLTGQLDTSTTALETTAYITNGGCFICPSSADTKSDTGFITSLSSSYAFAPGLGQQTYKDTALMADKKTTEYTDVTPTTGLRLASADNHGTDGVNVLYVRGNVAWVAAAQNKPSPGYGQLPLESLPNCTPSSATGLWKPALSY